MENKKKERLQEFSTEALAAELARRQGDVKKYSTLRGIEEGMETEGKKISRDSFLEWIYEIQESETNEHKPCPTCGRLVKVKCHKRSRTLMTLHGEVKYQRNYHWCNHCSYGFYPLDEQIGAPQEGNCSEGLSRRILDFGINGPYEEAAERFKMHYAFEISTHLIRCLVDRLPMPTFEESPQDRLLDSTTKRLTIQPDGSMVPMKSGWKEAKLGTFVCDNHHIPSDKETRGQISEAHYVATMGNVEEFEALLKNRLPTTKTLESIEVVWVGDGAKWIWEMARRLCPNSVQILDFCHAVEHGMNCGKTVLDEDKETLILWEERIRYLLSRGLIDFLLQELKDCLDGTRKMTHKKELLALLKYYKNNKERMDYYGHREAGRMIGSGIVESSHRHVIQSRMKRAGQHWSMKGAEKMVRLRSIYRTVGPNKFYDSLEKLAA